MEVGRKVNSDRSGVVDGGDVFASTSRCGQTGIVAPVFRNFAGHRCEADYLSVLAKYYDAVASCGHGAVDVDGVARIGDADVVRDRRDWWRRCGFGLGVIECGTGQGDVDQSGVRVPVGAPATNGCRGDVVVGSDGGGSAGSAGGLADTWRPVVDSDASGKVVDSSLYVPPHARAAGHGGGGEPVRGRHYASNKAAKERQKRKKLSARGDVERDCGSAGGYGTFSACTAEQRDELQRTRAQRLVAENKLRAAESERKLELLQAQDVVQLKKRQETRLMRDTELNKVQVEQAFGKLAGTGNVPGFAQTVVSSEGTPQLASGSISPNSSVSMAEVHAMQKENLEYRRRLDLLQKKNPELALEVMGAKLPSEQSGWTIGEDGMANCGDGFGVGGIIGADGRLHDYEDYADY